MVTECVQGECEQQWVEVKYQNAVVCKLRL